MEIFSIQLHHVVLPEWMKTKSKSYVMFDYIHKNISLESNFDLGKMYLIFYLSFFRVIMY